MRNAQVAYQAQLPSKTAVIMQVGIKDFVGEKYCHKDWEKIEWVTRTQQKEKKKCNHRWWKDRKDSVERE